MIRLFLVLLMFAIGANAAHSTPLERQLKAAFKAGEIPRLHGAIVDLAGERLAEVYFKGRDERWGSPLGTRKHGRHTLHDLRSVTKSVVGLLYGIALAEAKVPAVDRPLLAQFPEYSDLMDGSAREDILVEHALSMRMGTEWNETLSYANPRNSEIMMERARDRYRFVLDRPMTRPPGAAWDYNGGAVAIIGKLIANGTRMRIDRYARKKLFRPLGIKKYEWIKGLDGVPSAASGLRLTLRDLAKIGAVVSRCGWHDNRQIIPCDWIKRSMVSRAHVRKGVGYGYLWYVSGSGKNTVAFATGNGGQRLTVQPSVDLVVASFAGRYNDAKGWKTSAKVVSKYAVPEAQRRLRP